MGADAGHGQRFGDATADFDDLVVGDRVERLDGLVGVDVLAENHGRLRRVAGDGVRVLDREHAPAGRVRPRALDLLHLSGASAVVANLVNNLPAYLVVEPSAADDVRRLVATLVGVSSRTLWNPT